MEKAYTMEIAGLQRSLPLCAVNDQIDIAAFILFGDVELTVAAAGELLRKAPPFDIILTPEAKSIPLAYEMARQSRKPYAVARKSTKLYMKDPIFVEVRSITTDRVQKLYLGQDEIDLLRGRRVLIVDDVISTGESLQAVEKLVERADATIAGSCAILAEGDAAQRQDIFFLKPLPLFFK